MTSYIKMPDEQNMIIAKKEREEKKKGVGHVWLKISVSFQQI